MTNSSWRRMWRVWRVVLGVAILGAGWSVCAADPPRTVGKGGAAEQALPAAIPPDPPVWGKVRHELLCMDNGRGEILRVSPAGKIVWSCPAPGSHDAWLLPAEKGKAGRNVLFCYYTRKACGVKIVSPEKETLFHYQLPKRCEVHACQPLPDGRILIGACGPPRVIEIDRQGEVHKTLRLISKHKRPHMHLRQVRKTAAGTYLVCHVGDRVVREYDARGKVVGEFRAGMGRAAVRLANGHTLVSGGDVCSVTEFDRAGKVVWRVTKDDFPQVRMAWISGMHRLPNGNTVICNWLGHGKAGQGVPLFEVTRDKNLAWMFTDSKNTKAVTGVQVLDIGGDVTKGEVYR